MIYGKDKFHNLSEIYKTFLILPLFINIMIEKYFFPSPISPQAKFSSHNVVRIEYSHWFRDYSHFTTSLNVRKSRRRGISEIFYSRVIEISHKLHIFFTNLKLLFISKVCKTCNWSIFCFRENSINRLQPK